MNDRDAFEWVVRFRVEGDIDDLVEHIHTLTPIHAALLMLGIGPRLSAAEIERVEYEFQQATLQKVKLR